MDTGLREKSLSAGISCFLPPWNIIVLECVFMTVLLWMDILVYMQLNSSSEDNMHENTHIFPFCLTFPMWLIIFVMLWGNITASRWNKCSHIWKIFTFLQTNKPQETHIAVHEFKSFASKSCVNLFFIF